MIFPLVAVGFRHYTYIIFLSTAFLWFLRCYRQIYSALVGKDVLTVNESYIYDFIGDIKYYWKDVDEIYEMNSFLFIKLYEPEQYLEKIGNPFERLLVKLWFKPSSKKPSFFINIDTVAADPDDLLKILNDYSIEAEN